MAKMGDTETVYPNDTTAGIRLAMARLRAWDSPLCDQRIKALILTKLEEAELFSLRLVKREAE
jgi:hypothetical protein